MWLLIFLVLFVIGVALIISGWINELTETIIGVILIIPLILGLTVFRPDSEERLYEEYKIYALKDNITISGSGTLFYHYIDSDLNYHVRRDYKDGKKVISLDGDKVYLVESNEVPKVQIYREKRLTNVWLWGEWSSWVTDIKIYVPDGSMEDEFKSDME